MATIFTVNKEDGDNIFLNASSTLSIRNATDAWKELYAYWTKYNNVAVDLSGVEEFDSAGFQMFLILKREAAREGRRFLLRNHSEALIKVLDIYGAIGIFGDKVQIAPEERNRFYLKYGLNRNSKFFGAT